MTETVRRTARLDICRCGEHTMVGLDDDRCAFSARADIYPLSNAGEVAALRQGRHTYMLRRRALDRRDQWLIAGTPADSATVVAEHRCDQPVPESWRRRITPTPARRTVDADF